MLIYFILRVLNLQTKCENRWIHDSGQLYFSSSVHQYSQGCSEISKFTRKYFYKSFKIFLRTFGVLETNLKKYAFRQNEYGALSEWILMTRRSLISLLALAVSLGTSRRGKKSGILHLQSKSGNEIIDDLGSNHSHNVNCTFISGGVVWYSKSISKSLQQTILWFSQISKKSCILLQRRGFFEIVCLKIRQGSSPPRNNLRRSIHKTIWIQLRKTMTPRLCGKKSASHPTPPVPRAGLKFKIH